MGFLLIGAARQSRDLSQPTEGEPRESLMQQNRGRRSPQESRRYRTVIGGCLTLLLTCVALIGIVGSTGAAPLTPASPSGSGWPSFLDGPSHSSYNAAATLISPTNISDLIHRALDSAALEGHCEQLAECQSNSGRRRDLHRLQGRRVLCLLGGDQEGAVVRLLRNRMRLSGVHLDRHGGQRPSYGQVDRLRRLPRRLPLCTRRGHGSNRLEESTRQSRSEPRLLRLRFPTGGQQHGVHRDL